MKNTQKYFIKNTFYYYATTWVIKCVLLFYREIQEVSKINLGGTKS